LSWTLPDVPQGSYENNASAPDKGRPRVRLLTGVFLPEDGRLPYVLILFDIKMKICDESSRSWWYELSHIKTEPIHNGVDVRCVKWQEGPLTVLYPLYHEPTPVRRDIKGNSAHGTRGIWTGATRLPAVQARKMKLVSTPNLPGLPLSPHGREAHGTLGPPVLPTPVLTVGQNLFAISAGQGLGSTPPAHTPYQGNFYLSAAR